MDRLETVSGFRSLPAEVTFLQTAGIAAMKVPLGQRLRLLQIFANQRKTVQAILDD